jgi:hypothetical protein
MGASKAAREMAAVRTGIVDDLRVRKLAAEGKSKEADAMRLYLQHEKERQAAMTANFSKEQMAFLEHVQGLETSAQASARFADAVSANIPSLTTLALFRYRSSGGPIGDDSGPPTLPGRTAVPRLQSGTRDRTGGQGTYQDANVTINWTGNVVADSPRKVFEFVRDEAIRDRGTGGEGMRRAV